jgi:hypothetical protein
VALDGGTSVYLVSLGHAYARAGRKRHARATLGHLAQAARSRHVSAYHVAAIHAALGDTGTALDWLDRAYEERSPWLGYVGVDPRFESLRSHPRFDSHLRKARLRSCGGGRRRGRPVVAAGSGPARVELMPLAAERIVIVSSCHPRSRACR